MTDLQTVTDAPATFTEQDRKMLHEIHEAITGIRDAINQLPLDKLSKSPVFKMMGF